MIEKLVYFCEYCGFYQATKPMVEEHERLCRENPKNKDACLGCIYCEKVPEVYYTKVRNLKKETYSFYCNKLDQSMYPFSCVAKGLTTMFPENFEGEVQMPNVCEFKTT